MKLLACLIVVLLLCTPVFASDYRNIENEIREKLDKLEEERKSRDTEWEQIRQEQKIKALEEKIRKIEGSIA